MRCNSSLPYFHLFSWFPFPYYLSHVHFNTCPFSSSSSSFNAIPRMQSCGKQTACLWGLHLILEDIYIYVFLWGCGWFLWINFVFISNIPSTSRFCCFKSSKIQIPTYFHGVLNISYTRTCHRDRDNESKRIILQVHLNLITVQ